MKTITFTTADGTVLSGTLFEGNNTSALPVVIGSALAVNQRYYAAFAQWLADQGRCVMTFDVRGVGASLSPGTSVRGPTTRTSAQPSVVRPWMSERATRECSTSPTMATVRLLKSFL